MEHLTNLISRDHALIIFGISSLVSLISGIIITQISQRKSLESNSFYLKQSFYVDYVVHMLIATKLGNEEVNKNPQFRQELKLLEAEMLIKAEIEMLEDILEIRKEFIRNNDSSKFSHLQINTLNKFRKRLHNKPISAKLFDDFIQTNKSLAEITNSRWEKG